MQSVKRVLLWIAGVFCGLTTFGGVLSLVDTNSTGYDDMFPYFLILTALFGFGTFYFIQNARGKWVKREKVKKKSKKEQQREDELNYQVQRRMQAETATVLPVVDNPISVVLKPGEVCYYQRAASVLIVKNETVGHTSGSRGISVRVAKGVTLHGGGSRGHAIKQNVTYKFPGFFTMTSQRILMTGEKGFDYPVEKLTALTEYTDGVGLQFGSKNYILTMDEPYWPNKILSLMRSGAPEEEELPPITAQDIVSIHTESVDVDETIETPEGAEISYLDAKALKFWNKKKTDFEVPPYYSENAFGRNVVPALQRLLDAGYLELGDMEQRISLKTVPELKAILADRELKTSGNKKELVHRLLDNVDEEVLEELFPVNVYKITEKGHAALEPYSIIEDNDGHALGISYYRLLKEKAKTPDEENNVILTRILSEDIQQCYREQNQAKYQFLIDKTARFMREIGEFDSAFECCSLSFFMWTMEMKEHNISSGDGQTFYMAKGVEEAGKLCGYSFDSVVSTFQETIRRVNPFALGSDTNINYSVQKLRSALGT